MFGLAYFFSLTGRMTSPGAPEHSFLSPPLCSRQFQSAQENFVHMSEEQKIGNIQKTVTELRKVFSKLLYAYLESILNES